MAIIRLFIANLDYDIKEEEVRSFFCKVGRPTVINLIKDKKTGNFKGFGFVTLDTLGADQDTWRSKLQGRELNGRPIHIDFAVPKEKKRE